MPIFLPVRRRSSSGRSLLPLALIALGVGVLAIPGAADGISRGEHVSEWWRLGAGETAATVVTEPAPVLGPASPVKPELDPAPVPVKPKLNSSGPCVNGFTLATDRCVTRDGGWYRGERNRIGFACAGSGCAVRS